MYLFLFRPKLCFRSVLSSAKYIYKGVEPIVFIKCYIVKMFNCDNIFISFYLVGLYLKILLTLNKDYTIGNLKSLKQL